ncbi:MAG: copper chaperone PCu(A)C [Rhizobiaceae bacterium]|nr:copper chaperone PCu(A)C [Rhizobiaceae bacterium]
MRTVLRTAVLAACLSFPGLAAAHEFKSGAIIVDHPASRPTPKTAKIGVGYLAITNAGTEADRLVGGSSEASDRFELHTSEIVDGVARMRPVGGGITIEPGATVALRSGGTHVMLVGLKNPVVAGASFKAELVFENAGAVPVEFKVEPHGATAPISHEGHVMGEAQ